MHSSSALSLLLQQHSTVFGPVVPFDLNGSQVCKLDFTTRNARLAELELKDSRSFEALIKEMLAEQNATAGIGGYLENRVIYRRSALFSEPNYNRSLHLGIDIWAPAGTTVLAPLNAVIHSFQDNAHFGDYGPTIILQHQLGHYTFYTLYGHLSRTSLCDLQVGQELKQGTVFAEFGPYPENGDWPPHLHFQVINEMQGRYGDFPGVCQQAEAAEYRLLCPDPNLILQCRHLS
jgi:murein DD-endopeptidase MepM/ murein hydrolase activator NlpD